MNNLNIGNYATFDRLKYKVETGEGNNKSKMISPQNYYIVKSSFNSDFDDSTIKLILEFLGKIKSYLNLFYLDSTFYILFDRSLDNKNLLLNGNYQEVCSFISSELSLILKINVISIIIEFETQIQTIIYFHTKIYDHYVNYLYDIIKNLKITACTASILNLKNNIDIINSHDPKYLESISDSEKYGIFYKSEKDNESLLKISEFVDTQFTDKFKKIIFLS